MKTLSELRERCTVTEGGCWELDGVGTVWAFDYRRGGMRAMRPQRAAWMLKHKKDAPAGHRFFIGCGNEDCCRPEHVITMTVKDWGARVRRTGELRGKTNRVLANRAIGRKRSILTTDLRRLLNASSKPGYVLARELGISTATVSKGRRQLGVTAPANPWAGMGAR